MPDTPETESEAVRILRARLDNERNELKRIQDNYSPDEKGITAQVKDGRQLMLATSQKQIDSLTAQIAAATT